MNYLKKMKEFKQEVEAIVEEMSNIKLRKWIHLRSIKKIIKMMRKATEMKATE